MLQTGGAATQYSTMAAKMFKQSEETIWKSI